ncbi:hypothetical protein FRB97_002971 [Tulasnella sp. 331]|nr:hypothetical protein FRB97_002971 [Tulasnella sp. 331]
MNARTKGLEPSAQPTNAGWRKLMPFDDSSTRGQMSQCLKYDRSAINWMETMPYLSGWYDQSLVETVLDDMAFGGGPTAMVWFYLDGGSRKLSDKTEDQINSEEDPTD